MTGPALAIRRAEASDITALCAMHGIVQSWHADTYPRHFKPDLDPRALHGFWKDMLTATDRMVLCADYAAESAGYLLASHLTRPETLYAHARKTLHVEHLCVAPDHRRKGVATALLRAAEEIAVAEGCLDMTLDTWIDNRVAQATFESAGLNLTRLWYAKRLT